MLTHPSRTPSSLLHLCSLRSGRRRGRRHPTRWQHHHYYDQLIFGITIIGSLQIKGLSRNAASTRIASKMKRESREQWIPEPLINVALVPARTRSLMGINYCQPLTGEPNGKRQIYDVPVGARSGKRFERSIGKKIYDEEHERITIPPLSFLYASDRRRRESLMSARASPRSQN